MHSAAARYLPAWGAGNACNGGIWAVALKSWQTFADYRYILCLMSYMTRYIVVERAVVYDHVHFECIAISGRASNGKFEWLSIFRPEIPFELGTGVLP